MNMVKEKIDGLGKNKYITIISLLLAAFIIIYFGYHYVDSMKDKNKGEKKGK